MVDIFLKKDLINCSIWAGNPFPRSGSTNSASWWNGIFEVYGLHDDFRHYKELLITFHSGSLSRMDALVTQMTWLSYVYDNSHLDSSKISRHVYHTSFGKDTNAIIFPSLGNRFFFANAPKGDFLWGSSALGASSKKTRKPQRMRTLCTAI